MFRFFPALAAALLLALAAPVGAEKPAEEAVDHFHHPHRFVRIGDASVSPEAQRLHPGDAFGWVNYSRRIAKVSFDASVADSLVCAAPSGFRLLDGRLVSPDIQFHQFASLCSLTPGEYTYRIELRAGIGQGGGAIPVTRTAKLIVE